MGNIIQEMLAEDGKQIVEEIGDRVTWNGSEFSALVGDPDVSVDLDQGGLMPTGDFVVKILRADFGAGSFPEEGDVVTFEGKRYVVTRSLNKASSAWVRLDIATNA
jgi:hypothetical protein